MTPESDIPTSSSENRENERLRAAMGQIAAQRAEQGLLPLPEHSLFARAIHTIAREDDPEGHAAYNRRNLGALRALGMVSMSRDTQSRVLSEKQPET